MQRSFRRAPDAAVMWCVVAALWAAPVAAQLPRAAAQADAVAAPSPAPPDPVIDAVFAAFDRPGTPGCALGVYRDGGIAYARGYGLADLEHGVPITPSTIFDLGSTSKQFSAAAVVLLAQEGHLSLDDDVRRLVPELPAYGRPITIRQLLNHTSGMRDYIGLLTLGGSRIDDVTTADDALRAIARQRELNFEPGDEYLYSNSGYFLLSVIVERASGMSLRDFARTRIFDPLGMQRTHYLGSYDDVVPGRASAYSPRPGTGSGPNTDGPQAWRLDMSRWLQTGDGAVFSSIEELLLWDRNFYEAKVGGAAFLDALHTRGVLTGGDTIGYALGLQLGRYRGERTVRHGGSWGGYRAELLRFPDQRTSVAVLCNAGPVANTAELANRVADVVLGGALPDPVPTRATGAAASTVAAAAALPPALDAAQLARYGGRYYSPELDAWYTLEPGDGVLRLHRRNAAPATLTPVSHDTFTMGGVRVRFPAADGSIFLLDIGRVRNLRFERVEAPEPAR